MDRRAFNKSFFLLTIGGRFLFSADGIAQQQPGKKNARPNILFCIADDMGLTRGDWVRTPGLDKVAKNGILFTRAYTPNAKCAPSRACILTGRNSWQLEEAANHAPFFPAKFKTYPEALADNGYHVGCTGKGWAPGIAGQDSSGEKRQLCGKVYNEKKLNPPTSKISNCDYTENFRAFLDDRKPGQSFCFWYGGYEPHRDYEYASGIKKGIKSVADINDVYDFWPDNETVKTDMLDYALEVEWFDTHLQKMLSILEEEGELDNTLIVVTSDNGMPFPRIKGDAYERSNHLPLVVMWNKGIVNPGRRINDFVSFIDFAPTFLEIAQVTQESCDMQPVTGRSLTDIMYSSKNGTVNSFRDYVLIGKERHDVGAPDDVGYPIRGIVKGDYLLLVNFEPGRWPLGNPETGYLNCDGSPTKTEVLDGRENPENKKYWDMCFGKRPAEELYNISKDPDCINNLANQSDFKNLKTQIKDMLFFKLKEQDDPRMFGKGDIFDKYPYSDPALRDYYNRYMSGEKINAPWVNKSDYRPIE